MNDQPPKTNADPDSLLDKLVEEFTSLIRAGETPSIKEYQERYPDLKEELHEFLSSVAMIEGLKKQSGSIADSGRRPFDELLNLEHLGEYRLVRELGRGGMGIVLEAVHESLGRRVAIKVLPHRMVDNEQSIKRFTREARAAATLHHSNIVSVFGVGQSDGYYYYVMEFINGCALDSLMRNMKVITNRDSDATRISATVASTSDDNDEPVVDEGDIRLQNGKDQAVPNERVAKPVNAEAYDSVPKGPERFRWAAKIVGEVADALAYAHDQGVLHRDIKPANLLLDPAGRVWLTDFGLVKNISNQTMTMANDIVGTPQYMAPESFEGRYDIRSETYCLGATLYELITLQPACPSGTPAEVIKRVTSEEPQAPRKVDPRIPTDLSTVVQKAISKDPDERYQSATDLKNDLQAFLADRPISAKRTSITRRAWMWCRRNPWQTISAALVALVALIATAGFIDRSRSLDLASQQNRKLQQEQTKTREAMQESRQNEKKFRKQYQRAEKNVDISLEMFEEMFKQMLTRGTGQRENFSFDDFQELTGIATTVSEKDAQFLENMLPFYRRFAKENAGNMELIAESAKSFRRVANIYHLLGKPQDAREAYMEASKLYTTLNKRQPDLEHLVSKVQTANEFGILQLANGSFGTALRIFQRTENEISKSEFAAQLPLQMELIRTLNLQGMASPIESTTAMMRDRDQNASSQTTERRGFRRRRNSHLHRRGNDSIKYVSAAIDQVNRLMEIYSESHEVVSDLLLERAKSHLRLAELKFVMGMKEECLANKALAVKDLSRLNDEIPDSAQYRSVLAQAYAMPFGQDDKSSSNELKKAATIVHGLRKQYPGSSNYLQLDSEIHFQLGQLNEDAGKIDLAISHFRSAYESMKIVGTLAPRNPFAIMRLSEVTSRLSELLFKHQKFAAARDLLVENLNRITSTRMIKTRSAWPARSRIKEQFLLLAKCHRELGHENLAQQTESTERNFRRSLEEQEKTLKKRKDHRRDKRPPRNTGR